MNMKCYRQFIEKVGMDKVAHFFGVAFLAVFISLFMYRADGSNTSWVYAFDGLFAGIIIAVAKELFDMFDGGEFDIKDIWAGLIGAVVAFFTIALLL